MKYTREQLKAMSDYEINVVLSSRMLEIGLETWTFNDGIGKVQFLNEKTKKSRVVDYCNNWNDIMPLAVEHKIHFGPDVDLDNPENYYAISDKSIATENLIEVAASSPQRAIAYCLLMMDLGENK